MLPTCKIIADSELNTILTTKFAAAKNGHVEVGPDKVILPQEFEKHQEEILNFEVRDDDVYILTFPRTGTRWTKEMVWLLMNNLDFEKSREVNQHERAPHLELEMLQGGLKNYFQQISELNSPRCISTHLPWSLLPKSLSDGSKQPKMIVVLRGPEDTCLSYYHLSRASVIVGYNGTFEEFCDLFLGGKVRFGPYWNHVLGFWNQRDRSNIMFLKYNEMKADLAGSIRKVAEFLGKGLSDSEVAAMCDHLTFENLKTNKAFNVVVKSGGRDMNPFVRTGIVGGHKEVMSAEKIAAFKAQRELYLKGTDLTID